MFATSGFPSFAAKELKNVKAMVASYIRELKRPQGQVSRGIQSSGVRNRQVKYPRRGKVTPPGDACKMRENDLQEWKRDTDFQIAGAESNTGDMQLARNESVTANRLNPRAAWWLDVHSRKISNTAVRKLDEAIVYHQSDKIVSARKSVRDLFKTLSINQAHCFETPTKYDLQILNRGRQLFLEEGVSCSIKHGTLLLDSSTSGAQFYAGLLNVLAAFSLLISEFEIAQRTFDLLLQLHLQSNTTSRLQDLGAAYNNKGCVHLIMGDFQEAEQAFKTSLENFCLSESFPAETKVFAVNSNISRLNLISRNYPQALDQQEKLVKICQATEMKGMPYPFEVVFTVMNNQAVLHTTLNAFNEAENALRWLISYCKDVDKQDSLYLVTFLRLHLSEVLLLHGKPKDADEVFSIETLNSLEDVVDRFGNLYMNVRIEALEKLLAVYICKGKIKTAFELLRTTVKILKTVFGEDHFNVASLLYKQGKLLSIIGEFHNAAEKFESSSNILQQIFGVKNPLLLKCYLSLGDIASILGRKEESYVYYQRATETIEAIFQVSFVEKLSIKYMEVIQGYQTFQRQRVSEHGIESLVAEYGHVLATLLNHECNLHKRKCRADGKRVTAMKTAGPCSIARSTLSLKYSLDFLKSGRKCLRYGMIEEAVVFFQQADMHCGAHVIKGHPDVSVVRLHNIFLRRKRNIHETLESDNNLKNFLKALGKVMEEISSESIVEETTGVAPMTGFDHKQDLKPVIISLLLFCIELKMIKTTFEAYDLYCKLFQNETDSPLLLLDGIQVYASRTVITCNDKTALLDILISSEIGQKENDVEGDSADIQLFRNLECMENAPRNAFLVASKSPVFLDIDDFHALEEKISLAVQECFQRTCFEAEDKSRATQVIVDLTPLATCDIFSTGSRINLLPLCLLELPSSGMPRKETIFEIETSMRQTITRMNFDDEQTSCFMFKKIALQLLQQCDLGRSSVELSSQSFSLIVPLPKKTRVIMSRSGKLITQKIQFVTTGTANIGLTDALSWTEPLQTVEKYRVPCRARTSSEASLDQSVTFCETNGTSNQKWKWAKKSSQVCKGEMRATDEYDDNCPLPVSGDAHSDQAVVLCSGVPEAQMTRTCASSEVLMFQQSLSLMNLLFEQPDPDTKKKIHYPCLKAKTAKRLEVVKKLREITPAGTTAHNNQAVVLCSGVPEAQTTQTCDSSEVVAQFPQNLSLENLSLKQPDPDTKKKIRYPCLKAKTAKKPEFVEKLREITPADTTAPLEIISRGPSAVLAYYKALSEGKTIVKRVPIMFIGQGQSGKTSLKRSLKRERFNLEETITRGIETDPSYCKVSQEVWKIGESGDEATNSHPALISYNQCTAQFIFTSLKEGVNSKEMKNVDASNSESGNDPSYSKVSQEVLEKAAIRVGATYSDEEGIKLKEIKNAGKVDEVDTGPDAPQLKEVPDEIAALVGNLIQLEEAGGAQGKEDLYSIFWDFGGQSVYYATHPLFLTTRAIYLLAYNLSRDPNGKEIPQVKRGFYKDIMDVFCERSNVDYLDFWMSSVSSLVVEDEDLQQMFASEILSERLPPVFLVCTHADKPFRGSDPRALAREVFGTLKRRAYGKHLVDFFVVDNTKSGSVEKCPEVDRLRKEVETVANELLQMKEAIPIKWLKFEEEMKEKNQNGHKWISLDEAKNIATEKCGISDTEQFVAMLNFLHDQRILIHFYDTKQLSRMVILDPQWLIDVFKEVITIRPYQRQERKYEQLWLKLETTGILKEELLKHIWGPLFDNRETCHTLIAMMEKFCLLCPLSSSVATVSPTEYLVPSMLRFPPQEDVRKLIAFAGIPPLYLKFKSSQVPLGLFPRLVVMAYQWCREEFSSQTQPHLYQNFARFYTHPAEGCSLILRCHSSFIEVVVHKERCATGLLSDVVSGLNLHSESTYDAFQVDFARAVCRRLGLIMESMRKEFPWLKNMAYDLSVCCPVCCASRSVNHCCNHNVRGCKEEQCLHLLSESQLLASRGSIVCTRSVVAVNCKVPVNFVGFWFGSLEERQATVEYEENCPLPSSGDVHNDQAVVLCSGVLEVLTTQTCDASEVVAQFQQSLSLENLSLEQPDLDTKKKIRCLCFKAKTANKPEVVKKLREITPAGTTGPLLPETCDVAMIPLGQRRELTINLSGGDEWMSLAERLGLTPAEIRFLDKRVLNPCDAALEHARKQRLIQNVGDLYDRLVDCELPRLADLL